MTLPNPQVSLTCSNWVGSFKLFFGKTDAYNELLECGSEQFERKRKT